MGEVSNADPVQMTIAYIGHRCGCGFCGRSWWSDEPWPDCCPKMIEWKERLAKQIVPPASHSGRSAEIEGADPVRWERVARRISAKHRQRPHIGTQ